jgi:hypothetical protein
LRGPLLHRGRPFRFSDIGYGCPLRLSVFGGHDDQPMTISA